VGNFVHTFGVSVFRAAAVLAVGTLCLGLCGSICGSDDSAVCRRASKMGCGHANAIPKVISNIEAMATAYKRYLSYFMYQDRPR
jgi:hypothetical protein